MKTLLFLKRLDLALQLCALVIPALFAIKVGQYFSALYFYFVVGGAQLASYLIHAVAGEKSWKSIERAMYGKMLGILAIIAAVVLLGIGIGMNDNFIIIGLVIGAAYLVATPVIAALYFLVCMRETSRVAHSIRREMLIVRNV